VDGDFPGGQIKPSWAFKSFSEHAGSKSGSEIKEIVSRDNFNKFIHFDLFSRCYSTIKETRRYRLHR
jgi:hypothetical protein